jgi:CubicO group peptidase (beta-lactamase class C family)
MGLDFLDHLNPYGCNILGITNTDLCKACIFNTKAKRFYTYERGEHEEVKCTASNDDDGRLFLGWSLFKLFIATGVCLIIDKLSISPQHGDKFRGLHNTWNRTFTQVFNDRSKNFKIKQLYGNPTILELVCHFKGSPDFNHILYAPDGSPLLTAAEFLDRIPQYIKETRQKHNNVDRCVYSNANYILLALFIEEVSGQPFDIFLKENIFDPLKMNQTHMRREQLSSTASVQQRAQPYIASSNGHRHQVPEGCLTSFADSVERAVTGGYISAGDLAIFLDNIFKNLDNDDESVDAPLGKPIVDSLFTGVGTLSGDRTQPHGYTKVGMRTTLDRNFAGMHSLNRLISSGSQSSKETVGKPPAGEKPLEAFYIAGCGTGWAHSVYLIPTRRVYVFVLTNTTSAVDMSDIVSRMYVQQTCDLLPPALIEAGAIDQWDQDTLLKRRGEYCESLARQMRIENMPTLQMVELKDAAMDTPNAEHANIIGQYQNSKSGQVLTIINLDDPDGCLGICFTGGTKSSSLMRFIRTGEGYRICSSSPGTDVLPVDRVGAWKTVEFGFNTQNGQVVSLTRQGLYLDDVFTRVG